MPRRVVTPENLSADFIIDLARPADPIRLNLDMTQFFRENGTNMIQPSSLCYKTQAEATLETIPAPVMEFAVLRYSAATPRAPAIYRRTTLAEYNTYPIRLRINPASGDYFVIAEKIVDTAMAGAMCDGVTQDQPAIQACFDFFNLGGEGYDIRFSHGVSITSGDHQPDTSGYISGYPGSVLKGSLEHGDIIVRRDGLMPFIDKITFTGVTIEGDWGGLTHDDPAKMHDRSAEPTPRGQLILMKQCRVWVMDDCHGIFGPRQGFTGRTVEECYFSRCSVRETARSGLNVIGSKIAKAIDCDFADLDDDCINFATSSTGLQGNTLAYVSEITIMGCTAINTSDVKLTGAQKGAIVGNVLNFMKSDGIAVGSGSLIEGITPILHLIISNNVVSNVLSRTDIDGQNNNAHYIRVNQKRVQAGGLGGIPGQANPTTGLVVPYYLYSSTNNKDDPSPAGATVIIANNTIGRTVADGQLYSVAMGRRFFTKFGYLDDVVVGPNDFQKGSNPGVSLQNVHHALVDGNNIMGVSTGVQVACSPGVNLRNIRVSNNIITDFTGEGIATSLRLAGVDEDDLEGATAAGGHIDIQAVGNIIDGDPFHKRTNRGPNGTWLDLTSCSAMKFESFGGSFEDNKIRNVSGVARATDEDKTRMRNNTLYCQPFVMGSHSSNRGIRSVQTPGEGWSYVIEDCDPASATFGQVLNTSRTDAPAMPTTGYWLTGQYVKNSSPAVGGLSRIVGWERLTIGSSHVADTDWIAHSVLRGSVPLGDGATKTVQSSSYDVTAGRLLTVGAFGLGLSTPLLATDLNLTTNIGFYFVHAGSGTTNLPSDFGVGVGSLVVSSGGNANNIAQILIANIGGIQASWKRIGGGPGVWSEWSKDYNQRNVLGTVSQVAGIPTGALFEKGSNANGEWERDANGRQSVTRTIVLDATSDAAQPFEFSKTFSDDPVVSYSYQSLIPQVEVRMANIMSYRANTGKNSWVFRLAVAAATNSVDVTERTLRVRAEGRWF